MVSLRLKMILAAISFFLVWNVLLAPRVYTWLDNSEAMIPPAAFLIVFTVYFGCFSIIFLGLVEGNLEVLSGSLVLAVLTALGMLNIDLGESTIPISPTGELIKTSMGWKSDLSTFYYFLWSNIIPKQFLYFFVMFVTPAIVFTIIILSLTTKQVQEYWKELRF